MTRDRVDIEELAHDTRDTLSTRDVESRAMELAGEILSDENKIVRFITEEIELDAVNEIAVAVRWYQIFLKEKNPRDANLATIAILNEVRQIYERLRDVAVEQVREKAIVQLSDAEHLRGADGD